MWKAQGLTIGVSRDAYVLPLLSWSYGLSSPVNLCVVYVGEDCEVLAP
jgi:hypothetical protein